MANVCCSIEMEPRTLNQGQLNFARELAAGAAAQTIEPTEDTIVDKEMNPSGKSIQGDAEKIVTVESKANITGRPCQCSCIKNIVANNSDHAESPDQIKLREPLSAPF